jgi:hypothetical protein
MTAEECRATAIALVEQADQIRVETYKQQLLAGARKDRAEKYAIAATLRAHADYLGGGAAPARLPEHLAARLERCNQHPSIDTPSLDTGEVLHANAERMLTEWQSRP